MQARQTISEAGQNVKQAVGRAGGTIRRIREETNDELAQLSAEETSATMRYYSIALSIVLVIISFIWAITMIIGWIRPELHEYGLSLYHIPMMIFVVVSLLVINVLPTQNFILPNLNAKPFLGFSGAFGVAVCIINAIYMIKGFYTYGECSMVSAGTLVINNATELSLFPKFPSTPLCATGVWGYFLVTNIMLYVLFVGLVVCVFLIFLLSYNLPNVTAALVNVVKRMRAGQVDMNDEESIGSAFRDIYEIHKMHDVPLEHIDETDEEHAHRLHKTGIPPSKINEVMDKKKKDLENPLQNNNYNTYVNYSYPNQTLQNRGAFQKY